MVETSIWARPRWIVLVLGLYLVVLSLVHVGRNWNERKTAQDEDRSLQYDLFKSRSLLSTNDSGGFPGSDVGNCTPRASDNFPDDNMSLEFKRNGGVLIHIFIAIYAFGALAVVCNYYFISSMEAICERLNLSGDVAGATFMAIGTSAPEIGTAVIGVFITESNVGLDTVAGSTVFNMFFITSLCGLFGLNTIAIKRWPVLRDSACFITAAIALIAVTLDGVVNWYEGLIIISVYAFYIILMTFSRRIQEALDKCCTEHHIYDEEKTPLIGRQKKLSASGRLYTPGVSETDFTNGVLGDGSKQIRTNRPRSKSTGDMDESVASSGYNSSTEIDGDSLTSARSRFGHSLMSLGADDSEGYKSQLTFPEGCFTRFIWIIYLPVSVFLFITIPDCRRPGVWRRLYPVTFLCAVAWVSGLSYLLVWMIEIIGEVLFIPESVMGITFLAIGTSIPDAIASLVACRRGYGDMAISNILGSNILDLMCTGFPWLIKTAFVVPGSVVVTGTTSIVFTIVSLLSSSIIVIIGFICVKWTLDARVGVSYLVLYAIYIVICVLYELNFFGLVNLPLCPEQGT